MSPNFSEKVRNRHLADARVVEERVRSEPDYKTRGRERRGGSLFFSFIGSHSESAPA